MLYLEDFNPFFQRLAFSQVVFYQDRKSLHISAFLTFIMQQNKKKQGILKLSFIT